MKIRFWGARGSFATPGERYFRYGGHTCAVEVKNGSGERLLIDLGTGATAFARELMNAEFGEGKGILPVLLTHTHLDHIQGLPFFTPFFIKGNEIQIFGAEPSEMSLEQTIQSQLNPHYSPLYGLENLAAGVSITPVVSGQPIPIEGFDVTAASLPHGTISSLGFRIHADGKTLVFLSDVEYPGGRPPKNIIELARGADLLIHDAMFSDAEYQRRRGWGHSPVSVAVRVAEEAKARKLVLFHHSPDSTDRVIDGMVSQARGHTSIPVIAAAEGPAFDV